MHTVFQPNVGGDHVILSRTDDGDDHRIKAKSIQVEVDPELLPYLLASADNLIALLQEHHNYFSVQASTRVDVSEREYMQRKAVRIQEAIDNYKRNRA